MQPRSRRSLPIMAVVVGCAAGVSIAIAAEDWEHDWTVVTMARNGSWGVGVYYPIAGAIAAAIRECRAMSNGWNDCGAALAVTRGGWTIGLHCGDYRILATGEDLKDAEATALHRENNLKQFYVPDLPACQRVLTVDPRYDGKPKFFGSAVTHRTSGAVRTGGKT